MALTDHNAPSPKVSDHSPGRWVHLYPSHFLLSHPTLTLARHTHLLHASSLLYFGASALQPVWKVLSHLFSTPRCMDTGCLCSPAQVSLSHSICPPRPLHPWTLLVTHSGLFPSPAHPPLAYKLPEDFFPGLIRAAQMEAILHLQWVTSSNPTTP